MIFDPKKTYRTREGCPCRIYASDGYGREPIHGAWQNASGWHLCSWSKDGRSSEFKETCLDLIEVVPTPPDLEWWINEYPNRVCPTYATRQSAEIGAAPDRIGIIHLHRVNGVWSITREALEAKA